MNKYQLRLFNEWVKHGKLIIGVDFDDTISPWKLNTQRECDKVIGILKNAKSIGAHIVIFTACEYNRYADISTYCSKKGLIISSINTTPISLHYGNTNKIYANIFIDDRAGLNEALDILEVVMEEYLKYQKTNS